MSSDGLQTFPFSLLHEIIGYGSLGLESEDGLCGFISKGTETNREMIGLLEFVRFEYCSTHVMKGIFALLSGHFSELNASMWTGLRARLVLPNAIWKQFPVSVKKGDYGFDVPDGIIAHLTRECGGDVHDRHVVDVTSGSFDKEIYGVNPHSGAYKNDPSHAVKIAAVVETRSRFCSAYRDMNENIPHSAKNWLCYDFKERRIMPTHYTIRTYASCLGSSHLKSRLVETSVARGRPRGVHQIPQQQVW
jgi:hypothetical protein